jgi:hypothetical protein
MKLYRIIAVLICVAGLCLLISKGVSIVNHAAHINETIAERLITAASDANKMHRVDEWLNSKMKNYRSSRPPTRLLSACFVDGFDYGLLGVEAAGGGAVMFRYEADGSFAYVQIPWGRTGIIISNKAVFDGYKNFVIWKKGDYSVYHQKN